MERYIQQLIEDLEDVVHHSPVLPFFEIPPHLEKEPDIAELALVPFKPISEWTGIDEEVFPEIIELSGDQWGRVNEAIFKVFDALHIELIDVPADLPPEILYEVLTTNWDFPVQYLPSSGFDLELCTGDPMTCPYGEYCDCDEEPDLLMDEMTSNENFENDDDSELPFYNSYFYQSKNTNVMKAQELLDEILPILYTVKEDQNKLQKILQFLQDEIYEEPKELEEIEIPEKYKDVVIQIAGSIDAGFVCFLNTDTLETEEIPRELMNDPENFEAMTGESFESMDFKYPSWENCITFEPLESHESFKIMRKFTEIPEDARLQEKLENALNNRKPFANFKFIIDNSKYRQDWFDFKKRCLEKHVKELLLLKLEEERPENYSEEINGSYDDDGNKINPESVPVSNVCMSCKIHWIDNPEENLRCRIKRFEHRNNKDFKCGSFEKI